MKFVAGVLLAISSLSAIGETLQVYTADQFDVSLAQRAWQRLDNALGALGYDSELNYLPNMRSLHTVNTLGDFELFRVQPLKELAPKYTDKLIRISEPIITVRFYAISLREMPQKGLIEKLKLSSVGIQAGVIHLEKEFPRYNVSFDIEHLLKLLDAQRIEFVLCGYEKLEDLAQHLGFKPQYFVREFDRLELFTFAHIKHKELLPDLEQRLKSAAAVSDTQIDPILGP